MNDSTRERATRDHFTRIVTQWSDFGPPLRPAPGDTALMQAAIDELQPGCRAVLLGLTPEIVASRWPSATRLVAVDHSAAMIAALWQPDAAPASAHAIQADWCAMPIASGCLDFVAGDGCYIVLSRPEGPRALTQEVHRVLRPGGRFAIRVFLRPDALERIDDIARALAGGEIGSVHALKLRLLAALHGSAGAGVRLPEVWRAWKELPQPPAALYGRRGWSAGEIAGIESYRNLDVSYMLPTAAEFRASIASHFVELSCRHARSELGARCPTFVLAARTAGDAGASGQGLRYSTP